MAHDPTRAISEPAIEVSDPHAADPNSPTPADAHEAARVASSDATEPEAAPAKARRFFK